MRKTIAQNMEESQSIPTAIIQDFASIDKLVKMRNKINKDSDNHITFNPIFIKAVGAALKKYPVINSHYDKAKKEIKIFNEINAGVAVDTDNGLIVPVIKNIEKKSIKEISDDINRLVEQAKNKTISLEDLRGGTISLTNYGPFSGVYGRPMILPPQAAIVGFGRIHQSPIVKESKVVSSWILPISLAFDHRVVDGASAGNFVSYLLKLLNNPNELLISM